jgi:hypothetical protein
MCVLGTGNPCGCPSHAGQSRTAYMGQPQGLPVHQAHISIRVKCAFIYFPFLMRLCFVGLHKNSSEKNSCQLV